MKKFLLTLIVTMLTCIGAWAQEERNLVGNASTVFSSANGNLDDFCIPANNAKVAQMTGVDKIIIYARYTNQYSNGFALCPIINNTWYQYDYYVSAEGWNQFVIQLDDTKLNLIQSEGMKLFNASNVEFQRITFISESVPADVIASSLAFLDNTPTSVALGGTLDLKDYIDFGSVIPTEKSLNWASSNSDKIKVENGVVTGVVATDVDEKVTITATTIDGSNLSATVDLIVKQGYSLTLAADPASVINNDTRTVTITPTVKVDETVQEASTYSITYSLVDNDDTKVTIDGNVVTVAKDATAGTVTVKAEVEENDTYAGTSATTTFTIENAPRIIWPTLENHASSMVVGSSTGTASPYIEVGNSNYVVDGNGNNLNPQPTIRYEAEAIEGAEFVTILQNPSNEKWFHITPVRVGQATIKITAIATNNDDEVVASDEQTAIVNVTPMQIQFTVADNLTINDDQPLTLAAIKAAITRVYTEANSTETELPSSDYEVEIYNGDALVTEDIAAPHSADFTLTIKVKSKNSEYVDADSKDVTVTVTHLKSFTLALNGGDTSIMDNGQKAVITPAATYKEDENATPVLVEISSYVMTYTLSDADVATVVKNDDNTITVTGKNVGTVTVTVTAHPAQVEGADVYANVTNTTTINVTESQKVYLTTETGADGKSYVVVNVPEGGAFGGISDTPKIDESKSTVDLSALKNAANVKVKGSIANSDVQELVNLIGGIVNEEGNCKILDMGEATMTQAITATTYKCSLVGGVDDNGTQCSKSMLNAEKIVLPRPTTDTTIEGGTVLPANTNGLFSAWNNNATNEVTELVIPEGWTELADGCFGKTEAAASGQALTHITSLTLPSSIEKLSPYVFADCSSIQTVDMSACTKLTVIPNNAFRDSHISSLMLPPNVVRIENNAFMHHSCSKLFIPGKVDYIGCGAFTDWGGSNPMEDIYFLGTTAPSYVDQYAFSPSTQIANKTVNWTLTKPTKDDYFATRQVYTKDSYLSCILHFPKGCEAEYLDMSRDWEAEKRTCNGDGQNKYTPEGWDAETLAAIDAAITARNEVLVPIAEGIIGGSITSFAEATLAEEGQSDAGLPDFIYRYDKQWPSFMQMCQAYSIAYGGYHWDGTEMTAAEKDKRGIYQFVLYSADAPSSETEWEFKGYENDKWYTICIPFDMTVDQIKSVFGSKTQVCRFSEVKRETATDNKVLTLYFRNSVMDEGDGRAVGTTYNDADFTGLSGVHTGIMHHYPYMIKPCGNDATCETKTDDGQLVRIFKGYDRVGGILALETQSHGGYTYTFSGVFEQNSLTQFSYFLGRKSKDADHQFFFYKDATDSAKSWNEYTATVVVSDGGVNDAETFFGISGGTQQGAPRFVSVFGDDEEVTAIQDVEDVVKTKVLNDGKVYSISGQLIDSMNLPAGVYVKNGRKFIVK